MRRTVLTQLTEVLSSAVSNATAEATRVTGASRHHCDTPAVGICQPEPALNRCGSMRLTNFHYVQRACTPPHDPDQRHGTTKFRKRSFLSACKESKRPSDEFSAQGPMEGASLLRSRLSQSNSFGSSLWRRPLRHILYLGRYFPWLRAAFL